MSNIPLTALFAAAKDIERQERRYGVNHAEVDRAIHRLRRVLVRFYGLKWRKGMYPR